MLSSSSASELLRSVRESGARKLDEVANELLVVVEDVVVLEEPELEDEAELELEAEDDEVEEEELDVDDEEVEVELLLPPPPRTTSSLQLTVLLAARNIPANTTTHGRICRAKLSDLLAVSSDLFSGI